MDVEQAGTGPSRRHIQGSKTAKRLPSVKYSFTVLENRKFLKKKFEKITYSKKWTEWRAKVSQCRKSERGRTLRGFSTSILTQNIKKMQGDPSEKIFLEKKSRSAEKNERGEPLVSPGMVCYAEKQEKPFWFSSLDQIVQFGAIIFCRTLVELFWPVRVDRKKESL